MKKSILSVIVLAITFVFSSEITAQKFPLLDKSPMDIAAYPSSYKKSDKMIRVMYSRPQLKGRTVASLTPKGKIWRTGANEATEIIFYQEVVFGDKNVKAGSYTLFTIPNKKEWTIILSTAKNVWGHYFYKEAQDVVRVQAKVSKGKKNIEAFSIVFNEKKGNITMHLGWGKTRVSVPIKEVKIEH